MVAHGLPRELYRDRRAPVMPEDLEIPLPPPSLRKSRGFTVEPDSAYVSTESGLRGARAALIGIGLEALAVGCVLCIWLVKLAVR